MHKDDAMLTFQKNEDSNFAAEESSVQEGYCRIAFTPSPHDGIAKLWFHWVVRNESSEPLPPQTRIILKNLQGVLGAEDGSFQPVIRTDKSDWERLHCGVRSVLPDGRTQLEWIVKTPQRNGFLECALCYPYWMPELERMCQETGGYWVADEIGVTREERRILRLSNCYGNPERPERGLYLLARQHAGETPGSWVLDGLLRRLAERKAPFPVWCIPFADPDGIANGDYGKDSFPQDMNRSWGPFEFMRHETKVIGTDLREWRRRILPGESLVLDFHAPGADETGVYAYVSDESRKHPFRWKIHDLLPRLDRAIAPCSQTPFLRTGGYKKYSAWGEFANLSEFCLWTLPLLFASIEISYWKAGGKVLTRKEYQNIGSRITDEIISIFSESLQSGVNKKCV